MVPLEDEDVGNVVFLLPIKRAKLTALMNFHIRELLETGEMVRILEKYGLEDRYYHFSLETLFAPER